MSWILQVLLVLFYATQSQALPVASDLAQPISSLGLSLVFLPFPALLASKLLYVWYRRAQSIHDDAGNTRIPMSVSQSSLQATSNYSFIQTGYLVGFLGSPDWETRIKCRRDVLERRASRQSSPTSKNSSSVSRSRTLADSTVTSHGRSTVKSSFKSSGRSRSTQSRPRTLSTVYLDTSSPVPHLDITSCANVHPGSPPCSPVLPPSPAACVQRTPKSPSPTLMQMMGPVLSSWYDGPSQQQDRSTSSVANTSSAGNASRVSAGADQSQNSKITGKSTSPDFHTPPTSPNTPLLSETAQVSLSVAISTAQLQASSSLTFSVFEAPSVPVPAPVYTPSRRSCGTTPEEWISPTEKTSPTVFDAPSNSQASTSNILQLVAAVVNDRKTLAGTTLPLNVVSKSKPTTPEDSPVLPPEERLPQISMKRPVLASRKSMSPLIGPSPLRNSLVPESISGSTSSIVSGNDCSDSIPRSPSGHWQLEDLVRDGQLDVDAVRAALGLGLMCPCDDDAASIGTIPSNYDTEDGHQGLDVPISPCTEDVEGIVSWGRTRDSGATVQFRIAGTQLSTIVEESDVVSVRQSRGSASQIDLKLLGLDQKGIDIGEESLWESVWDAEASWIEGVSKSESIGLAR